MVPPVFSGPQIEHDGFAQLLVSDKKSKGGHVHVLMPFLYGLDEGFAWYDNIGCGVDYGHFYRRIRLGKMKGRVGPWLDLVACHG